MDRQYHRWFSPRLNRDMELLVFGHAGPRTLVFPTRAGRFYDYENWGLVEVSRQKLESGQLQLFCVDSIDNESLYCTCCPPAQRIGQHVRFEEYVLNEVLPLTRQLNPHSALHAHGCSIGAYHAVNIAFRHPHLFQKVVALSGRYNLANEVGEFRDLFDGFYDETIYFNTPLHFVPNLDEGWTLDHLRRMKINFVIGEDDAFLQDNHKMSDALWAKGVANEVMIWEGEAHRARHWRQMAPLFL